MCGDIRKGKDGEKKQSRTLDRDQFGREDTTVSLGLSVSDACLERGRKE